MMHVELQSGVFEIYKCDIDVNGFKEYMERFQTFIMFFLDGSVFIDLEDSKFNYYVVLVEMYHNSCIFKTYLVNSSHLLLFYWRLL